MKQRGFYYTFVVFLLVTLILITGLGVYRATAQQKESIIENTAFDTVNSRFANIQNEIFTIKTGYPGRQQSRILTSFDFEGGNDPCSSEPGAVCDCDTSPRGCGWTEISQPIPQADEQLADPFDALNLYEIFIKAQEISSDLNITAEAAKNDIWDGTQTSFSYLFLPQCVTYAPRPENLDPPWANFQTFFVAGQESDGCTFDVSSIKMIEVSIVVETVDATPVKLEKFEGKGVLSGDPPPTDPYDPDTYPGLPWLKIELTVPDCAPRCNGNSECCITDGYGVISGHVDPLNDNGFELQLDLGDAIDFYILSNNHLDVSPAPPRIVVVEEKANHRMAMSTTKITFNEPINNASLNAFDFNVEKPGFENLTRGIGN